MRFYFADKSFIDKRIGSCLRGLHGKSFQRPIFVEMTLEEIVQAIRTNLLGWDQNHINEWVLDEPLRALGLPHRCPQNVRIVKRYLLENDHGNV